VLCCLLGSLLCGTARALEVPTLAGRVNDRAGLLAPEARQTLEQKLEAHEKATGQQFAVLTLESLEGEALEEFSIRVVEAWKLGKKGKDDGLLLLVVKAERKVRIEVGYGLEGSIPDALAARVTRNIIAPAFRKGDYSAGIARAVDALIAAGAGEEVALPGASKDRAHDSGPFARILTLLAAGPVLLIFLLMLLGRMGGGGRGTRRRAGWYGAGWGAGLGSGGFGGGSFGGGGFGGSSGGGFSGGGGGFGGGGASGSW
jgi:uncharacterized protein